MYIEEVNDAGKYCPVSIIDVLFNYVRMSNH